MGDRDEQLAQLLPRVLAGEDRALHELLRLIWPDVLRYCRARILGGAMPTAEDVAQEVCLAVTSAVSSYVDTGRPFMAYVFGIAAHKVADARRTLHRDGVLSLGETPDQVDAAPGPEDVALVNDAGNRMRLLLDELSDKARDIVTLRVFVGLSVEETARIVDSTPGAVRVAQHRALKRLRDRLALLQAMDEQEVGSS